MLQRVYERSRLSALDQVIISTDDERIFNHAKDLGAEVIMTSKKISNGTLRCFATLRKISNKFNVLINIQGDEPFIDPKQIDLLINAFKNKNVQLATLAEPFEDSNDIKNPNNIKVVVDKDNFALYFSRSVIPYQRNHNETMWIRQHEYLRHIGIYAFRTDIIPVIEKLKSTSIESSESLEQLRWLYHGLKIKVLKTKYFGVSVDTPEDLERANYLLNTIYE